MIISITPRWTLPVNAACSRQFPKKLNGNQVTAINESGMIYLLATKDNWEKVRTEVFPINQDGTLDKMIIENKKYGKNRIK